MSPPSDIWYRPYRSELDLPSIMRLVSSELSEPYIIYTYRYFLVNWCGSPQSSADAYLEESNLNLLCLPPTRLLASVDVLLYMCIAVTQASFGFPGRLPGTVPRSAEVDSQHAFAGLSF